MDVVLKRQSEQFENIFSNQNTDIFYDRELEWGFLRKQCLTLELEPFYNTYTQRLQRSYLSIFIVIQTVVGITHSIILVAADGSTMSPEIFSYLAAILAVYISLFITFREDFIKRRQWVAYVASFIAIFMLVLSDLIVPLIHSITTFPKTALRPAYGSYILYAVYIFLPLSENIHAFLVGLAVTGCYIVEFSMVTYRLDEYKWTKTTTEAVYLLSVNFFGIYFRFMKEIAIRTAFLDRRGCVEENLLLRNARDQERSLLLSILPVHIADTLENDIRQMFEIIKQEKMRPRSMLDTMNSENGVARVSRWTGNDINKLKVEEHKDVSVLYADVVNYTYMTTQLDVKALVETLHELFVKFDQASEEYNVLRIKFLGDCYSCVSGVPERNPYHAKSCVDLGLRMIRDIRDVRNRRKLNIDMRIGVHSGNILSGIIGACKWQYDIWSKDVDIANKLESTGKAGRVHVTRQTLDLLNDAYEIEPGTEEAKRDSVLIKYGIETFLIVPRQPETRYYPLEEFSRHSIGVRRMLESSRRVKPVESVVHKNFMQNTIEQFIQIRAQVKLEMGHELDKMPIGKFHLSRFCLASSKLLTQDEREERNFRSNVSTVFLLFKDLKWELLFLVEPDIMLKYSSLIGFIGFLFIMIVQGINNPNNQLFWIINGAVAIVLIIFLPITWFKKLWIVLTPVAEEDSDIHRGPKRKISKFFYKISTHVMTNIYIRVFIYLMIVAILCLVSLLHLIQCQIYEENYEMDIKNSSSLIVDGVEHQLCFNAWAITESLVLTLCMSFLFVRIPFMFKFVVGIIIASSYAWLVFVKYPYIYNKSPSTNYVLDPKYAHLLVIAVTFGIFHMVDRQTEYIAKIDYNWKRQLQKKQRDAEFTNETIKLLVHNILPAHVADIYMSRKMKDELYNEEYENVAIMFATIKDCDIGDDNLSGGNKTVLNILNSIICDFDEILVNHNGPLKIEKIKVAGWTYMAACGLNPGRGDSTSSLFGIRETSNHRPSAMVSSSHVRRSRLSLHSAATRRLSWDISNNSSNEVEGDSCPRTDAARQAHNNVYVLTEFALELMRSLQSFNRENFQNATLRVGISHGKIMAGVVGSSKPLYDVWGNAVNMASRMDSTGICGKIQVTESTAKVLKSFRIKCEYRGLTFVKGKNHIPTYFVEVDKDLNFIQEPLVNGSSHSNRYDNNISTKL